MKILNLKTNNIFNLPKEEAKKLLEECPEDFVKGGVRLKKSVKKGNSVVIENCDNDSILSQIIE